MNGHLIVRADLPDSPEQRKDTVIRGLESGVSSFIVRKGDGLGSLGVFESIFIEDLSVFRIDSPGSQEKVLSASFERPLLVEIACDWKVIPLENIVARFKGKVPVYVCVDSPEQAELCLNALELGADGAVIDHTQDPSGYIDSASDDSCVSLSEATVTSVRTVSMGDRVCIDTCSVMGTDEGMLVGSFSEGLFLVSSESNDSGYVASRPFRVNAGAVHSYISVPGGRTGYLSEMRAGSEVTICDRTGHTRTATVGRAKIESRPLILIQAECEGRSLSIMLQNAETVRLMTRTSSIPMNELREGDTVLVMTSSGGRHFGMSVDENVTER